MLLFRHLELEFILDFLARLLARGVEPFLNALLDGQVGLAQFGIKFALLANQVRLRLLGLG